MSTIIPSLGAEDEIKRQQIKFSDSELDLATLKQMDNHTQKVHFPLQFLFNYDGPRTKVV